MRMAMRFSYRSLLRVMIGVLFVALGSRAAEVSAAPISPQIPTDWNLYMLRLVNRARTDPVRENAIQGTAYSESATHPLAYDPLIGRAAQNHNEWMGLNTFSHYESKGTAGWTGYDMGDRFNYVGYNWSVAGENILRSSIAWIVNQARIEADHSSWWKSDGHRQNFMDLRFTVFGHQAGNANGVYLATQNLAKPQAYPKTYIFGLVFDDKNTNGFWDPFDAGSFQRESLGAVPYEVFWAGTNSIVGTGETFDNGAYSFNVGNGTYDIEFNVPGAGTFLVEDIVVNGTNVNAGDLLVPEPTTLTLLLAGSFLLWKRNKVL